MIAVASAPVESEVIIRWTGHRVLLEGLYQRHAILEDAERSKPRRNPGRQAYMRLGATFPPGPKTGKLCFYRFVAPR